MAHFSKPSLNAQQPGVRQPPDPTSTPAHPQEPGQPAGLFGVPRLRLPTNKEEQVNDRSGEANPTPYPPGEGPRFRCSRSGGASCGWTGFPTDTDRCPLHQTGGPHRYEALNFNPQSFQPLWNHASLHGCWLYPADFMAMGCRARFVDGVETVIFSYKFCATRCYLYVDDHGYSAWSHSADPEPVPPARAIEHATQPGHHHDDGCLSGSRVVTIARQRKAG